MKNLMNINNIENNKVKVVKDTQNKFWSLASKISILVKSNYVFDLIIHDKDANTTDFYGFNYCDEVLHQFIDNEDLYTEESEKSVKEVINKIKHHDINSNIEAQIVYNNNIECIIL